MLIAMAMAAALGTVNAPQDDPVTDLGDIIVNASPALKRARGFIDIVAAPPSGRRLARWDRSLCVSVAGLAPRYGQFVADRVSASAASVGLDPGQPGCRPHILIVFTFDPDEAAGRLIDEDADTLRPDRHGATDRGQRALETFRTTDAPVRWWHVSAPVSVLTGDVAIPLGDDPAPVITVASNAGRLVGPTHEVLQRAVIVVDANQLGGVSYAALGEYLGVIALAQVDPDADLAAYPSILNLFAGSPSQRLTDWDQDYLQALYAARGDRLRFRQQANEIARRMADRDARARESDAVGETLN